MEASDIDIVLLTHAHLDHCGYLPILVRSGYSGKILMTPPTRDLPEIILLDSAKIQEEDAERANRMGYSKHKPAKPLYTIKEAEKAIRQYGGRVLEYLKSYVQDSRNTILLVGFQAEGTRGRALQNGVHEIKISTCFSNDTSANMANSFARFVVKKSRGFKQLK